MAQGRATRGTTLLRRSGALWASTVALKARYRALTGRAYTTSRRFNPPPHERLWQAVNRAGLSIADPAPCRLHSRLLLSVTGASHGFSHHAVRSVNSPELTRRPRCRYSRNQHRKALTQPERTCNEAVCLLLFLAKSYYIPAGQKAGRRRSRSKRPFPRSDNQRETSSMVASPMVGERSAT
jgi:hypothetical protein